MEQQTGWRPHADFMNGLVADGFVRLGGPLEGTPDILLIGRAGDEVEVRTRLTADPWSGQGLLEVTSVAPWTLRMGLLD